MRKVKDRAKEETRQHEMEMTRTENHEAVSGQFEWYGRGMIESSVWSKGQS